MAMNDPILNLLRRRIGLDTDSLGERVIEDCLADLSRRYPDQGRGALALLAETDAAVFADVVGHFVVNESWLFRTPEQFAALQKFAQTRPRPLNILSLPAANGEEPASIAVSLHEAGLQAAFKKAQSMAHGLERGGRAVNRQQDLHGYLRHDLARA